MMMNTLQELDWQRHSAWASNRATAAAPEPSTGAGQPRPRLLLLLQQVQQEEPRARRRQRRRALRRRQGQPAALGVADQQRRFVARWRQQGMDLLVQFNLLIPPSLGSSDLNSNLDRISSNLTGFASEF